MTTRAARAHSVTSMLRGSRGSIHEFAAALERADASARVLGARAVAARDGAGPAAAFSALAAAGPEGLVPKMGTGGAMAARHLEQAALAAASAGAVLPEDVTDALAQAVAVARAQSGGANALDPRGAAAAVRRQVAAVRGLADDALPRDDTWHVMRLGTFLPRAAWMSALLMACAAAAHADPAARPAIWRAAALVAGPVAPTDGVDPGGVPGALLLDVSLPMSVARAVDEVVAALFALSRQGAVEPGALAMARATAARLGDPALRRDLVREPAAAIGTTLDAIGAIASSSIPRPAARPASGAPAAAGSAPGRPAPARAVAA